MNDITEVDRLNAEIADLKRTIEWYQGRTGIMMGEATRANLGSSLTFSALREANTLRLPQFKNAHGQLAHSMPDGSDWSPAEWLQAVIGEAGEYANFRKKYQRGDITAEDFAGHAAKELADVQIYLDILARRCLDLPGQPHPTGIDLGEATRAKFNEVSERVGSDVYIDNHGGVYRAA